VLAPAQQAVPRASRTGPHAGGIEEVTVVQTAAEPEGFLDLVVLEDSADFETSLGL